MNLKQLKDRRFFEFSLIAIVIGMACVAVQLGGHKLVVLNLFYLPIILSGYYLGRSSACVLSLLCVLTVTIVTALDPTNLTAYFTPLLSGLSLAVWAAVLAVAAILVGTLCDERARSVEELHQAYVGVVEVLSRYLQGGHTKIKDRSVRVAELCEMVAETMKLSRKQIDDIRVGALLFDLGNVEITTKLIAKAVDSIEASTPQGRRHTFAGMDLVHSLGSVLHGAVPLLLSQDHDTCGSLTAADDSAAHDVPLGARIIRTVRAYDSLTTGDGSDVQHSPAEAIALLRRDPGVKHDENVLAALRRVVDRPARTPERQTARV